MESRNGLRPALQNNGIILSENKADYQVSDLHASDNGSVIVSFSRDTGFRSNRYLYANKLSASGKLLWGASHVHVWDGGSLQLGNYPSFRSGRQWRRGLRLVQQQSFAAGAMCSTSTPPGTEVFPHNGVVRFHQRFADSGVAVGGLRSFDPGDFSSLTKKKIPCRA